MIPGAHEESTSFLFFMLLLFQGHQQLINDVSFSPDGRLIASGSFDKSIKLWDGKTGKCVAILSHDTVIIIG